MSYDFDVPIDRRHSDSVKWNRFDEDVIPMWIADMDFRAAEPVIQALRTRVEHGVYGYRVEANELREVIAERVHRLYGWQISPEAVVIITGIVPGFNLFCRVAANAGQNVLVQTPLYYPILRAPAQAGLGMVQAPLTEHEDGSYTVDFDAFERAITDQTRIFILCNPHNPVGRVFRRAELQRMADICLRHKVLICSDEIHCDIIFDGHKHVPIASIAPEIADQTITFMAPTKTFNLAGLKVAVAIVTNPGLRTAFETAQKAIAGAPSVLSVAAALAAYHEGQPWLDAVLAYLQGNRDYLAHYIRKNLPKLRMTPVEATYLAWIDCRKAAIPTPTAGEFFLEKARVGFNDGSLFGREGEGFIRLNFACTRATLEEALQRMERALATL